MTVSISAGDLAALSGGSITSSLEKTGRLPPVSLIVTPLSPAGAASAVASATGLSQSITLDRFLTYEFNSSVLIPVDSFSFTFVAPDGPNFYDVIKDGDIVSLFANDKPLATGIIDVVDIETDNEFGEKVALSGRDLLQQFEDQDAISVDDAPLYAQKITVAGAVKKLMDNTRIKKVVTQDAPSGSYLFATEPGESKLAALQRFLEPLNCIFWMGPTGSIIVGKPNMSQAKKGRLVLNKAKRISNVINIKAIRSATSIPNILIPIWSGQELVQNRVKKEQRILNTAEGPKRLRKLGHRVPKTVVVSTPQGSDPQSLSGINDITAAGSTLLQAHAKREMARQNQKELIVQVTVPGHYNESGEPYLVDQVYKIEYDRAGIDENMYLFQIQYSLSEEGQKSQLYFCRLGTIVADIKAVSQKILAGQPINLVGGIA